MHSAATFCNPKVAMRCRGLVEVPMAKPKRMGRPPTGRGTPVQVRMGDELLAAVDREVQRVQGERPGSIVTRADVVREIVGRALLAGAKREMPGRMKS
jgi:hypothetical protein